MGRYKDKAYRSGSNHHTRSKVKRRQRKSDGSHHARQEHDGMLRERYDRAADHAEKEDQYYRNYHGDDPDPSP